jgi:hypothetical protein
MRDVYKKKENMLKSRLEEVSFEERIRELMEF